jgi:hypothetical protein
MLAQTLLAQPPKFVPPPLTNLFNCWKAPLHLNTLLTIHFLPMDGMVYPIHTSTFALHSLCNPQGVNTIYLPKMVLAVLQNSSSKKWDHPPVLLVMDTGTTDHMHPDKLAFISHCPVDGCWVRMGNNSLAQIRGHGMAIISLNGKKILIRDCLHISDLRNPLYSLWAYQHQRGCRCMA